MKRTLILAAATLIAAAGCSSSSKPSANLQATPSGALPPAQPAGYVTTAQQPMTVAPVDTYTPGPIQASDVTVAPTASLASTTTAAGGKYVVKKGDTFYGIARAHYGDGKQWTKIAQANPTVNAAHLRVGQVLVLP
jgi:5'-nucleotidase